MNDDEARDDGEKKECDYSSGRCASFTTRRRRLRDAEGGGHFFLAKATVSSGSLSAFNASRKHRERALK